MSMTDVTHSNRTGAYVARRPKEPMTKAYQGKLITARQPLLLNPSRWHSATLWTLLPPILSHTKPCRHSSKGRPFLDATFLQTKAHVSDHYILRRVTHLYTLVVMEGQYFFYSSRPGHNRRPSRQLAT